MKRLCTAGIKIDLFSDSEVDEPRVCYTEGNKSEIEKQISYINTYIWNLEK